jgi:imidazolonepropionase-like amidohydrolase
LDSRDFGERAQAGRARQNLNSRFGGEEVKILVSAVAILITCAVNAQSVFPVELEIHRKPVTTTKGSCLITGARVLTAANGTAANGTSANGTLENTDILVIKGKISQIGRALKAPAGVPVIHAEGKVVAPGLIDGHSHRASDGTNEGADSITGEVRIGDVLNLSSLTAWQALASGHTSALILHGSANNVGGQSIVIKYKYNRPSAEAPIKDAPRMIKFALGENVTRKSSENSTRFPRTRMGQEAVYRRGFTEARKYKAEWEVFRSGKSKVQPRRDLRLETLSDILDRKIWVQCHSYRSDEMLMMIRLSQEFGFKIGAMQHALEAYKIAPELAKAGVGVSIFVDSWSFKQEGYDSIPWNAAICEKAGVNVSINTDGVSGTTALNIDAAKTMRFGGFTEQQALQTITINPAKELGIDKRTGSIEVGKDADLAIWDGHPLSVYSKCALTMIEGEVFFERRDAFGIDKSSTIKTVLDKKVNVTENQAPVPVAGGYAITNATIHPVSSPVIPRGTVVFVDGKIVAVGERVSIPRGVRVLDGKGLHVYPGFFDGGTSMGLLEISPIPVMVDNSEFGKFNADLDALTSLWVESTHYAPARFNGVTNAFIQPSGGTISGQGAVINTDGYTTEEFGVSRRSGLVVNFVGNSGSGDFDLCDFVDSSLLFGGADLGKNHVPTGDQHLSNEELEQYYDYLGGRVPLQKATSAPVTDPVLEKYFNQVLEYAAKRKAEGSTPVDTNLEAMIPYVNGEKLVILNARKAVSIRQAIAFAEKFKLKAAIQGASEAWRVTDLLKKSGIPVIVSPAGKSTLGANTTDLPYDPYDTPYVRIGLLAKAGVKFCFAGGEGSESMMLPVRVGQSCAYGLSPEDALRGLTLSAAEIFGVSDKLGSLQPGKIANVIVTDGDPFEMTSTMRYVFINGKPRPLESKHTKLRDKYMARLN